MFAYGNNNPIMYIDSLGTAPEWWQWAISGVLVVGGTVLVATGAFGMLGGVMICAGVNSMVGSYTSESAGGTSTAGWLGGLVTGTICGTGVGIAGNLLLQASGTVGTACIGNLVLS